jgi:hypothetical protein
MQGISGVAAFYTQEYRPISEVRLPLGGWTVEVA